MVSRPGGTGQATAGSWWSQLSLVWKIFWGALGGIATFALGAITFMQAPAAFEDIHRRMCGGSWQQYAGRFGDCSGYAEKPTQIVISGSAVPQTKGDLYQLGYRRFWESVRENDEAALNKLHAEGWRIKTLDACRLLQYGPSTVPGSSDVGEAIKFDMAKPVVDSVVRFSSEKLSCWGKDVAVELLSGLAAFQCFRSLDVRANAQVTTIDAIASAQPSQGLRELAGKMLEAYKVSTTSTRDRLVAYCIKRYGKGRFTNLSRDETQFLDLVFRFSASCNAPAKGLYLGFDPFSYTRDEAEVADLCRAYVKQGGIDPKVISFKSYLERWAK